MKTVLTAAIAAVVVTLGTLYLWPQPAPPDSTVMMKSFQDAVNDLKSKIKQRPVDLIVVLLQAGPQCKSITSPHGLAYRDQTVRWMVFNINCNLNGNEIEIRFAKGYTPLEAKLPKHLSFIQAKVRSDAAFDTYKYGIWSVGKAGEFQLEDPELAIGDF